MKKNKATLRNFFKVERISYSIVLLCFSFAFKASKNTSALSRTVPLVAIENIFTIHCIC